MYSNELICNILDYINSNINKEISIDELSNTFFFNRTYIMKKFKKEIGISINNYINSMRIYNSLPLFKNDNYILNIAYRNGFNSIEYFSEIFKKIIGVSPIIYKKYVTYNPNVTTKQETIIREACLNLNILRNRINTYLSNRQPAVTPVKKIYFALILKNL